MPSTHLSVALCDSGSPTAERRAGFLREFGVGAQQRAEQGGRCTGKDRTGELVAVVDDEEEKEEEEECLHFPERLLPFTRGRMIGGQLVGASLVDQCQFH